MTTFEDRIKEAARRIDPRTARLVWRYTLVMDPYSAEEGSSPEYSWVGSDYFLVDREKGLEAWEPDVRRLHRDIPDAEWDELMRDAATRSRPASLPLPEPRRPFLTAGRDDATQDGLAGTRTARGRPRR